jgi:hypothetical protein
VPRSGGPAAEQPGALAVGNPAQFERVEAALVPGAVKPAGLVSGERRGLVQDDEGGQGAVLTVICVQRVQKERARRPGSGAAGDRRG